MGMTADTFKPRPYQDPNNELIHRGIVSVTGTLTIDLGVGHNNFVFQPCIKGGLADLAPGHILAWDYGSVPGTVTITIGKATSASVTTVIAATAALDVSFVAIVDGSV